MRKILATLIIVFMFFASTSYVFAASWAEPELQANSNFYVPDLKYTYYAQFVTETKSYIIYAENSNMLNGVFASFSSATAAGTYLFNGVRQNFTGTKTTYDLDYCLDNYTLQNTNGNPTRSQQQETTTEPQTQSQQEETNGILSNIWEKIKDIWSQISTGFANVISNIVTKTTEIWNKLNEGFTNLWNKLNDGFGNVVTNIVTKATEIWNKLNDGFASVVTNITTKATELWNKIHAFYTLVSEWFTNTTNRVRDLIIPENEYWSNILTQYQNKFNFIVQIKELTASILTWIRTTDFSEPPTITINLNNTTSRFFKSNKQVVTFSLEWFEPYRPTVQALISGVLWIMFLTRTFARLPDIIAGTGTVFTEKQAKPKQFEPKTRTKNEKKGG